MRNTIWLVILLGLVGCTHQEVTEQISIGGHGVVTFKRVGNKFVSSENDRFAVVEAGLTTLSNRGKELCSVAIRDPAETGNPASGCPSRRRNRQTTSFACQRRTSPDRRTTMERTGPTDPSNASPGSLAIYSG